MPPSRPDASEPTRLEGREALAGAAAELARAGRRTIVLLTYDLPEWLYGTDAFCDAVKDLALGYRRAEVRILVNDPTPAGRGHRLVDMGRQLSSFVQFRRLAEVDRNEVADWLLVDGRHRLHRPGPGHREALVEWDAPASVAEASRRIRELWERAQTAPELRQLHI